MAKARKRGKRYSYADKSALIAATLVKEIDRRRVVGYENHMFRMSEIAELTGYARSNRFMATLYQMVDDRKLRMVTQNDKRGVTDFNVFFTLPEYFRYQELFAS